MHQFTEFIIRMMDGAGIAYARETISYILMLPLVVTFITFSRQVFGLKGFGIYTPLLITFSLIAMGPLKYGLSVLGIVLVTATLARLLIKKFRILYLPRIAIVLSLVTLAIFVTLFLGAYFGKTGFLKVSVLPILVMIILSEDFVSAQMRRNWRSALWLTAETLFVALVSYFALRWPALVNLVLHFPLLAILFAILVNLILGKWTLLRFSEFYRFRRLIFQVIRNKK